MKDFSKEYEAIREELREFINVCRNDDYLHPTGSKYLANIIEFAINTIDEHYRNSSLKLKQLAVLIHYLHGEPNRKNEFEFNGKLYPISYKINSFMKNKNYSLLISDLYPVKN